MVDDSIIVNAYLELNLTNEEKDAGLQQECNNYFSESIKRYIIRFQRLPTIGQIFWRKDFESRFHSFIMKVTYIDYEGIENMVSVNLIEE